MLGSRPGAFSNVIPHKYPISCNFHQDPTKIGKSKLNTVRANSAHCSSCKINFGLLLAATYLFSSNSKILGSDHLESFLEKNVIITTSVATLQLYYDPYEH